MQDFALAVSFFPVVEGAYIPNHHAERATPSCTHPQPGTQQGRKFCAVVIFLYEITCPY